MKQKELLMHFMRSLKTKGLLDVDIHGSVVDVFLHSELPKLVTDEVLPCVRFTSLKNDLLIDREKVKDDRRMAFDEPSSWSHKIARIDAKLELIAQLEKDEI